MKTVKLSAILVTFNEELHLTECLTNLSFADELIVIDLGSSDSSVEIAKTFNAKIVHHERVPIIEMIREWAVGLAQNDWIVFVDPDEIFPTQLIKAISNLIISDLGLASIGLPRRNYYLGEPVRYGRWGDILYPTRIFNKKRMLFNKIVHSGFLVKNSFHSSSLKPQSPDEIIKHYWIDTTEEFYSKHKRYLQNEGIAMYQKGCSFSLYNSYTSIVKSFFLSYFYKKGFLLGKTGFDLATKWSWYSFHRWEQLKQFEATKDNLNTLKIINKSTNRGNISQILMLKMRLLVLLIIKNSKSPYLLTSYHYQCTVKNILSYLIRYEPFNKASNPLTVVHDSYFLTTFPFHLRKKSIKSSNISLTKSSSFLSNTTDFITNHQTDLFVFSFLEYFGIDSDIRSSNYSPNADILLMSDLLAILPDSSKILLIIPVGLDSLYSYMRRVYGVKRLPLLLKRWNVLQETYLTTSSNCYYRVSNKSLLLSNPGRAHESIGFFLLQKAD